MALKLKEDQLMNITKEQLDNAKPVLMMDVDGTIYPVAMTKEQQDTFEFTLRLLSPIKIMRDYPQGKAINLKVEGNQNESKRISKPIKKNFTRI